MLTPRAWWFLVTACVVLLVGLLGRLELLTLVGLALLLWLGAEWALFTLRLHAVRGRLHVAREIHDERGPVVTLWAGRAFDVRVRMDWDGGRRVPYVAITDAVPFGLTVTEGVFAFEGELRGDMPLELLYRVRCPVAGVARFEGLRVRLADPQGFFYHALFVHAPVVLPVLPALVGFDGRRPSVKRYNLLPPPGIHRLRRPGSGSELLDLRDYLPGDPPRTIAWKVSARRDRLITKEFESEVPVRCTLFVDTSSSVRVNAGDGKALSRLLDIAAGVAQASAAVRDLTGLCLFDEHSTTVVRPERTATHLTRLLRLLAGAAARAPHSARTDPEALLPLAYGFAQEVYPELLQPAVNAMPGWLTWFLAFPGYRRRRRGLRESLYRHKRLVFFLSSTLLSVLFVAVPTSIFLAWYLLTLLWVPPFLALGVVFALPFVASVTTYLLIVLVNRRARRLARWRKRLAALLSVHYGLAPGGLEALLEDDDQLSLLQQRFLAEHQVPYSLPLYDGRGRYLFAAPEKVPVLARALLHAVGKGHDNELFVLLADLLELDARLEPLLRAVRVALARHHHVLVICPWPPGVPLPGGEEAADAQPTAKTHLHDLLGQAITTRFHAAYRQVRRTFGRLGVQVVCAAGDEPVPLILARLEELRTLRRAR